MEAEWLDSLSQDPKQGKQWSIYFKCEMEKSTWEPTQKQKTKRIQTMVWAVQCGVAQREKQKQDRLSKFQSYME